MSKRAWQLLTGAVAVLVMSFVLWMGRSTAGHFPVPLTEPGSAPVAKPLACADNNCYRFVAFGDWGTGNQFQKDVAAQLIKLYGTQPFDAALLLGDNIYEFGNVKKHGKEYFTDMYAPLIRGGVCFIVALGNHDTRSGFEKDQLQFFNMPGYYYTARRGPAEFFVIDSNKFPGDEVQQKWLDKALGDSKAPLKVVMGHHPIYSSGQHGNHSGLIKTLEPLLVRHQVDLYLAGHDHNYERFEPINGVTYIVSGGGGAYLRDFLQVRPHSIVRKSTHHFLSFELKDGVLHLWAIDKTGKVIDKAQWQKPAAKELPAAS